DQDAVTGPQGLGVAASRADVAGGRRGGGVATGDGVDAVTLGAAERVLLELDVAVTVQDVLTGALVVRAVGLLHVLGRGVLVDGRDQVTVLVARVDVTRDGELGTQGAVPAVARVHAGRV